MNEINKKKLLVDHWRVHCGKKLYQEVMNYAKEVKKED